MALPHMYAEKDFYTEDEYFEFERTALGRWEYDNGQIRAMAGGTDDHSMISGTVARLLGNTLIPRGCRVYGSDMKVHCGDGYNTFPDVSVVCGSRDYHRGRNDIILNPVLLVEVLSPSTEAEDRGPKFDHYRSIPTLIDYLLVAQDEARALLLTRRADIWEFRHIAGLESTVFLTSLDVTLALSDIYTLIEFAPAEPPL